MTSLALREVAAAAPVVDITVPVYNEERDLEPNVRRLHAFLRSGFPFRARITIADNASTDGTWAIAQRLAHQLAGVRARRLEEKGRGRALATAWLESDAQVVCYMDVDLSTDLRALLPLVAPLVSGHSDVAIGSRLANGARVVRGPKRELISRAYNLLLRAVLRVRFRDAQCGFKAVRADVARRLVPRVEDGRFFFDTELLVLAEREHLRISEIAVDWTDDPDSRVDIVRTALEDLHGIWRMLGAGRLASFAAIGVASTAAYAVLYLGLRELTTAAAANLAALLVTAFANTAANRRLTFRVAGRAGLARDHLGGLAAFLLALAITNLAVAGLAVLAPSAGRAVELAVLVAANLLATVARFAVLSRVIARAPAPPKTTFEITRRSL